MPNGHYDEEAGVSWDDEYYDEEGETDTSEPYKSQLPEHCQNPWGGYDSNCLFIEVISNAAIKIWKCLFGGTV
jgi:hypothetical protein